MNKKVVRDAFWAFVATLAIFAGLFAAYTYLAPTAKADPGIGCETIHWGFLGFQRRTICDGARQPDGSWTRARRVWVPAHWQAGYCSYYGTYCSQGYPVAEGTVAFEQYPVTDATVLGDEPGWLPGGSLVIR